MSSILSLGFDYKGSSYSFLARVKEKGETTEYHITVMNGDLEKVLYGNHVISGINGHIIIDSSNATNEQQQLKNQVAKSLNNYLNEQSLTSY